jgi:hypothetical protein
LQKEHAAELADRQSQIGLVNEVVPPEVDGVVDAFTGRLVDADGLEVVEVEDQGHVEHVTVNGDGDSRVMRVNTDIDDMTYGVGNTFSLKRGVKYRVSEDLYHWLDSKGLVV